MLSVCHKSPQCKSNLKSKNTPNSSSSYAAAFLATSDNDSSAWYIDSGAIMHMTRHHQLLKNVTPPSIQNIKVANDKTSTMKSTGEISIETLNGQGQSNRILLQNVLHVPELAVNLISVCQITENSGNVSFNSDGCVIMNKRNNIVATAKQVNNMYRINDTTSYTCISDIKQDDNFLWHQIMAHLNFHSLKKMTECTEGIKLSNKNSNLTCITCQEVKQSRLPFKSQVSHSTQH